MSYMQPVCNRGTRKFVHFGSKVEVTKMRIKLDGVGPVDNRPSID